MRRASGGRASHRGGQVAPGCRTRELRLEDNQAGIELFLVHYDNGSAAYRRNFSWYGRVAYTYESRHTNYMHRQHAGNSAPSWDTHLLGYTSPLGIQNASPLESVARPPTSCGLWLWVSWPWLWVAVEPLWRSGRAAQSPKG